MEAGRLGKAVDWRLGRGCARLGGRLHGWPLGMVLHEKEGGWMCWERRGKHREREQAGDVRACLKGDREKGCPLMVHGEDGIYRGSCRSEVPRGWWRDWSIGQGDHRGDEAELRMTARLDDVEAIGWTREEARVHGCDPSESTSCARCSEACSVGLGGSQCAQRHRMRELADGLGERCPCTGAEISEQRTARQGEQGLAMQEEGSSEEIGGLDREDGDRSICAWLAMCTNRDRSAGNC